MSGPRWEWKVAVFVAWAEGWGAEQVQAPGVREWVAENPPWEDKEEGRQA